MCYFAQQRNRLKYQAGGTYGAFLVCASDLHRELLQNASDFFLWVLVMRPFH